MICRSLANITSLSSLKLEFSGQIPADSFKRVADAIGSLYRLKKVRLDFSLYSMFTRTSATEADCFWVSESIKRLDECIILKINFSDCEFGDTTMRILVNNIIGFKNLNCLEITAVR